jgi:tRNA-dihydrouridine synthase
MNYYCAPLEGITDDLFRTIHHRHFPGVDKYYTPFLSPTLTGPAITKRDLRQVLPENNEGFSLVPQVLTSNSEIFLRAAKALEELGYREINLNLGCPSGTVCAKGKGAGFLSRLPELEQFLDEIFAACPIGISIKTRLGKDDPEEFYQLLELYNSYPIQELTVHPRVQKDMYKHPVRMEYLGYAETHSKNPLCLSGGIGTRQDAEKLALAMPLMLGRGLIANPALVRQLQGGASATKAELEAFHGELFEATASRLGSPRSTMFRMKELWSYLILMFDHREKYQKALRKTTSLTEYGAMVAHIFRELPLREDAEVNW